MAAVHWTVGASDDLRALVEHTGRDSPRYAAAFAARVVSPEPEVGRLPLGYGLATARPNPPGSSYISPGYSSDAVAPLVMTAITAAPAEPVLKATDPAGTAVLRLDVSFTGVGHIIDLGLADDAGGRLALNGRNLVATGALDAGAYTVTVKATQRGNPANALTKAFTVVMK